jgi:hypothetical protein
MSSALQISAQELNCRVVVDGTRAQTQERQIFPIMENEFTRFLK